MAKFEIIKTRKVSKSTAEFDVIFIQGMLKPGDVFTTYDTHHPVHWTVLEVINHVDYSLIKCATLLGLCWDDQFAGGIVDTDASGRSKAYKYSSL